MDTNNEATLERTILVSLPSDRLPGEQEIRERAHQLRALFPVSDAAFEGLLKRLTAKVVHTMDLGVAIVLDHKPWLNARKPEIDPYYWRRFDTLLTRKDWPPRILAKFDRVTDDILDVLGDPQQSGHWQRRGLVVGDVQSGKTATYTALCCKAGDAGYRLIILLTGTLESLRRQTQERLDEGFVGRDSSGELSKIKNSRAVGVGLLPNSSGRAAQVLTSRLKDFNKNLLNSLGITLNAINEPLLVVVKKNKRILENLEKWLRDFNSGHDGRIDVPLLVIDDEADSASVNTRAANEDPTEINKRIRSLLALFTRSSYVGFTATPFANVFIDPETEHDMLGNDLFPRDFIYSLEPPTNYFGPQAMFGEEPRRQALREIDDADSEFPPGHKSDSQVTQLPVSLVEAVRAYLLATTIRDLRSEGPTHRSMLVNVSRFTAVQDQVAALLHQCVTDLQQDIRNYSQLSPGEALKSHAIAALKASWEREFKAIEPDWAKVQRALLAGVLPVVVQAVNQRTGAASLDYARHRETGLRVIAVGGNSLSRGLTLEGLSTSYFFRNSQMYDTLLQMGRWFGYRDGYEDLCRLWLTDEAAHWYAHITIATDELRSEVKRMREEKRTPREFGLKVRAHPDSLIVTAQNKMRQSKPFERRISISAESLETPRLKTNENTLRANRQSVVRFVEGLRAAGLSEVLSPKQNWSWSGIPKRHIVDLLRSFDVHPLNISFQAGDLATFLDLTSEPRLQLWDVVLPKGRGRPVDLAGMIFPAVERNVRVDQESVLVSGKSARIASRGIESEGMDPMEVESITAQYKVDNPGKNVPDRLFRESRRRPLLLVHVIEPKTKEGEAMGEVIALGLSFPRFDDSDVAKQVKYRVNLVAWKSILEQEFDEGVEDEVTDSD